MFCFDFKGLLSVQAIIYVFIAFCGDFFSTLGTVLGVAGKAGMLDEDGNMPGIQKPFLVDAIGTCVGACTGNTTITTFVESTSGVEDVYKRQRYRCLRYSGKKKAPCPVQRHRYKNRFCRKPGLCTPI